MSNDAGFKERACQILADYQNGVVSFSEARRLSVRLYESSGYSTQELVEAIDPHLQQLRNIDQKKQSAGVGGEGGDKPGSKSKEGTHDIAGGGLSAEGTKDQYSGGGSGKSAEDVETISSDDEPEDGSIVSQDTDDSQSQTKGRSAAEAGSRIVATSKNEDEYPFSRKAKRVHLKKHHT